MPVSFTNLNDVLLLNILEQSHEAVAVYDSLSLNIRFVSDGMLRIWGKNKSVIGKTFEEAIPEIVGQPFTELLQNVWLTGETYIAKSTPATLEINGVLITSYFDFEYRAIKNDVGDTNAILHTAKDVTEQLKALEMVELRNEKVTQLFNELSESNQNLSALYEEQQAANEELLATNEELGEAQQSLFESNDKLAESELRLRSIFDQSPVGIAVLRGPNHVIEIVNQTILNIWGRKIEDVLNKPHKEARPELEGQPVYNWLDDVYKKGIKKVNNEFRVWLYDEGKLREAYVNSVYQPLKNAKGEITGVLVILDEITDIIKTRQESAEMQEIFRLAIEAGELGTFYYNPKTNEFTGNDLLKDWFGVGLGTDIDLGLALANIAEEDRERVTAAIIESLSADSSGNYEEEYTIVHPITHQRRTVRAKGKTFFDHQGEPSLLSGTLQDITERKKDEERKNDFIAMVSHELKTPLTAIKGYLQLLHRKFRKEQDNYTVSSLERTDKQVDKMISLIHGFLDVSRLETGKLHIEKETFDFADLLSEAKEEAKAAMPTHRLEIADLDATTVFADREKIGQVLHNLISNAAKYSPLNSTITIHAKKKGKMLECSISDNGIGIPANEIPHLFERYYRVKEEQLPSVSGFGIGLYLCTEIIQRHNGKIWAESEYGKGSTFHFVIPC